MDTGGQSLAKGASEALLARAKQLDLGGEFELPPGDPITHFGAGYAKIIASNVFLSGLDPEFTSTDQARSLASGTTRPSAASNGTASHSR